MSDTNQQTQDSQDAMDTAARKAVEHVHLEGMSISSIAEMGARASGVSTVRIPGEPFGIAHEVPIAIKHGENPRFESLKSIIDEWRTRPRQRKGIARVGDVESFCALLNRHKTDHSVVFAVSDWQKPSLEAIVDYHEVDPDGLPDNGQHRIRYDFPFSEEWKTWLAHDGKPMDQAEFAEFMEERAPDMTALVEAEAAHFARQLQVSEIAPPTRIFELARGLQINVASKIKNDVKLQSGESKLVFEEEHTGANGQPVTVPGAFALSIPLFYNEEPVEFPVRLRYRVRNGTIHWTYKLFRVDRTIAEAVDLAKNEVIKQTELPVYEGTPEMRGA